MLDPSEDPLLDYNPESYLLLMLDQYPFARRNVIMIFRGVSVCESPIDATTFEFDREVSTFRESRLGISGWSA